MSQTPPGAPQKCRTARIATQRRMVLRTRVSTDNGWGKTYVSRSTVKNPEKSGRRPNEGECASGCERRSRRGAKTIGRRASFRWGHGGFELFAGKPEAPFAPGKSGDGFGQVGLGEIRPEHGDEEEFGIGGLEKEKIAHPRLARGADDEIGIRQVGGIKITAERRPRGVVELFPAGRDGRGVGAGGVDD